MQWRASDEDRERTVSLLREATARGYLNLEEFDERMETALRARYLPDLDPVLADIPGTPRPSHGWAVPVAGAASVRGRRRIRPAFRLALAALMGALAISVLFQLLFYSPVLLLILGFFWWRNLNRRHWWRRHGPVRII